MCKARKEAERLRAQEQLFFTVLDVCRASLFRSSVLRVHVHCSVATSCNQLTQTHVTRHFILLLYIYARQGVDPSCPIGKQYNYSCIVLSN